MTDLLFDLLRPSRLTSVVDIGANPIDGVPPYKSLLQKRLCRVIGFEPQPLALAALNSRKSDLQTYLPYVIGDGENAVLKVCSEAGMTSLLAPDPKMLEQFPGFSDWGRVIQEIPVSTRRLDDVGEIDMIDYLKIDVQGAELSIFKHGKQRLSQTVVIHTEVSFLPLYKDQPVFGDIDHELRNLGFVPHCFAAINRRMIAPLVAKDPYQALNQLLEADVVYVRDFTQPDRMSSEQLKHLAIVAHHCYGSFDLTTNCLHHLIKSKMAAADSIQRYVTAIQSASAR